MSTQNHPYTEASNLICTLASKDGSKISRADSINLRAGIAAALNMSDADLANKLSAFYRKEFMNEARK